MKRTAVIVLVILTVLYIGVSMVVRESAGSFGRPDPVTRTQPDRVIEKEEAEVSVAVRYLSKKTTDRTMTFEIATNTHSVNMDGFDFRKQVGVEADGKLLEPVGVETAGGGHHQSAEMTFPRVTGNVTVVVTNLAGIPRREFVFTDI